jgi:hypothetical protein
MFHFDQSKAQNVAEDTRTALESYDNAIRSLATLTVSVITAASDSNLSAQDRQDLMEAMHTRAGEALNGRAGMVSVVSMLATLQRRSNHAETNFGCPGPVPLAVDRSAAEGFRLRAVA